jgi:hypothetical protein
VRRQQCFHGVTKAVAPSVAEKSLCGTDVYRGSSGVVLLHGVEKGELALACQSCAPVK